MRGFRIVAMVVLGIPAMALAAWMVCCVLEGAWLTAFIAFAGSLFWVAALLTWAVMPTSVPFAVADDRGTTVRPDRRIDRLMLVWVISGFVGFGGFGSFGFIGWLDLPILEKAKHTYTFTLPFAVFSLFFLAVLWVTARRGGMASVRLTPEGFEFAERFTTSRGEWSKVVAVSDEAPVAPLATSPLVLSMSDGTTVMLMESALFGPRNGLMTLIEFLWRNPDSRDELVDGRAVARLLAV